MGVEDFGAKRESVKVGDVDVHLRSLTIEEMGEISNLNGNQKYTEAIVATLRYGIEEPKEWKENPAHLNASLATSLCSRILRLTETVENHFNPTERIKDNNAKPTCSSASLGSPAKCAHP